MEQQQRERRRLSQQARRAQAREIRIANTRTRLSEGFHGRRLTGSSITRDGEETIPRTVLNSSHNCGRNFNATIPYHKHRLPQPTYCDFCNAKIFFHESLQNCCSGGSINIHRPTTTPQQLLSLFQDQGEVGTHFRTNIRSYNNAFSFTSMGASIDNNLANAREGVYTYRAQGSIYHSIGSLLPLAGSRPRYLQLYIYDTDHEIENRLQDSEAMRPEIIMILKQILDTHNPYVSILRQLGQQPDVQICRIKIKEITIDRHLHELPTTSQVAGIIIGDEPDNLQGRDIIVRTTSGNLQRISDTAGFYDPLQYPLLLPYGQHGWDLSIHENGSTPISCTSYYSHILQIRPTETSLILLGGRLFQQYAVDMYVKIETMRLRFLRNNQTTIRAELYQGLQDALATGETSARSVGVKKILPSSHIGSPRDMHQRYQDAMALVRRYGKPDLFITMTCNTNWVEITQELLPGQQPQDRPDLTTRIFRSKLEQLKTDLFDTGVLGKVIAHVHVIEFQKRGLPHSHILLILDENDKINNPDDYDALVRAEIPCTHLEPELHNAVMKHMIHYPCGHFNPRAVCMKNNCCKKGFPKAFSPFTLQGTDSYPIYKRRDNGIQYQIGSHIIDNRWIVPYNPYLLLKYDCHINVEICSSIKSVKYLYKYVYKGSDRVSVGLSSTSDDNDEISKFVNARWICAPEALWRIFKFSLSNIFPSVTGLQIHLPNRQQLLFRAEEHINTILDDQHRSKTMLTEFFCKNVFDEQARQYLYYEFPEKYWWDSTSKQWNRRRNNRRAIGRIYTVSPTEGDRYYLRLLLTHVRGPQSFTDLLTVNQIEYNTFKESAEHRGLLENDNSIKDCLTDASNTHMPNALRRLFVTILVYCDPCHVRELWEEFSPFLLEDYPTTSATTVTNSFSIIQCLSDLDNLLKQYNKTIFDYDIPHTNFTNFTHTNTSTLISEEQCIEIPNNDINSIDNLNSEQKKAFDTIMSSVESGANSIYFIDGPGGTGKTYLYRAILAHLRIQGHIAIAVATSGIASLALPGGRTAHSRFKIPINLDSSSTCHIPKQSELAKLLLSATVFLWDEATMAHRHAFEAVDRTLRDLTNFDAPFGGKIVILGGDFRQVLPIVVNGTRAQTVDACIVRSYLWQNVQVIHLTQNMRAKDDQSYAQFLLRIGNGDEVYVQDDIIQLPNDIVEPWTNTSSLYALINEVFAELNDRLGDPNFIMDRAILAPTNETVDDINNKVIELFPGTERIYYSFDKVEEDTHNLYQYEFLNSLAPGGLPPHKLRLKVGAPIMLLRNIDPRIGLCNGTRLLCRVFHRNVIDAEITVGHFRGTRVFIPRIPLKPSENTNMPFNLIRKQFPIKLAFSLTINKSQGQTIPRVGIYLPEHVFSHGQLYVALSRGVSRKTTKVLVKNGKIRNRNGTHTRNVVYKDVLLQCTHELN